MGLGQRKGCTLQEASINTSVAGSWEDQRVPGVARGGLKGISHVLFYRNISIFHQLVELCILVITTCLGIRVYLYVQ